MASASSLKNRRTPGVYVTELDAFPPSVIGVQTAVPAFIGYTETAQISGKPVFDQAIKIGSMADFEAIFGKGYKSVYTITALDPTDPIQEGKIKLGKFDFKVWDSTSSPQTWIYYTLTLDPTASKFNLYNSMRLFYANGGGNCYVVSVGPYIEPDGTANQVNKAALKLGLAAIKEQVGPTMLVVPDATLLPSDPTGKPYQSPDFEAIVSDMLGQCSELQDRVAILDVYGTDLIRTEYEVEVDGKQVPTLITKDEVISQFRTDVGEKALNYGMAYFPFLHTTVVSVSETDYTHIDIADSDSAGAGVLQQVLTMQAANLYPKIEVNNVLVDSPRYTAVVADINKIEPTASVEDVLKLNQNLTAAIPLLLEIESTVTKKTDVLPPSAAMAGVFTYTDGTVGVWNAPANISLSAVPSTTFKLNNEQQGDLNLPVNGKAIDAIREFVGRGTVVWGARTLDGNSNDWRYIQVRRTLIYIEQSVKNSLNQFVFAANDGKTWVTVTSMISSFLQSLWSQGGLMGATASEAFSVECGLGSTMTSKDILEGYMVVQITLQMIRPAEFIELTFKQKMDG